MSYNPKWVKGNEVIKRDGSNTLTGDWDIGDKKKIILDELRGQDSDGLTLSDSTGNVGLYIEDGSVKVSLNQGTSVNEFSTDGTLSDNSDDAIPTEKAVKTYVDSSVSGISGSTGVVSLLNGDTTSDITFDVAEPDTNYRIGTQLINTTDITPSLYTIIVTEKTISGFRVEFSGEIDSNNYELEWYILRTNP